MPQRIKFTETFKINETFTVEPGLYGWLIHTDSYETGDICIALADGFEMSFLCSPAEFVKVTYGSYGRP